MSLIPRHGGLVGGFGRNASAALRVKDCFAAPVVSLQLVEYNAGLLSITLMTFLGFADDLLDVPWRAKMLTPLVAAVPLLVAYTGRTTILLPDWLVPVSQCLVSYLSSSLRPVISFLTSLKLVFLSLTHHFSPESYLSSGSAFPPSLSFSSSTEFHDTKLPGDHASAPSSSWLVSSDPWTSEAWRGLTATTADQGFSGGHALLPVGLWGWGDTVMIDLGMLYYVYMALVTVFCTNAINIYAGQTPFSLTHRSSSVWNSVNVSAHTSRRSVFMFSYIRPLLFTVLVRIPPVTLPSVRSPLG